MKKDLKIIAGTITIIGALFSILDKVYAPHYLLLRSSPEYPKILRTLGWIMLLIASLIYIFIDILYYFKRKNQK
jgi:hypothetical protein